jgi:zinc transporter ZupT
MELLATGLVAALFALIHLFGDRLRFLNRMPRSLWLSAAGGVSVAYVFVHILPDLAEHQQRVEEMELLASLERQVWLIALVGLGAFHGLERLVRRRRRTAEDAGDGVFWLHLGAFALYNFLIGYLLLHREEGTQMGLIFYAVAMGLHFLVNDQGLREHHGRAYHRARWLLAAAPLAGWALGAVTDLPPLAVTALFAFVAGGVILNVLKEELPEDRDSRFRAFAGGAAGYAALLLLAG